MTELAMFKEFARGGVKHWKSFWTAHIHQCLTEVCKPINLCRLRSFAETCKTDWFSRGPDGFGHGNVVSDTFMQWLSSGEERKWGPHTGVGAMGDGLVGRKDQRRQQQQVPRLNHHPWRRCLRLTHHPWRRHITEVEPLGSGLEARWDRGRWWKCRGCWLWRRAPRGDQQPRKTGGRRQWWNHPWRLMGGHAWTARQLGTHGLAVRWCMQMPRFEDVSKVGNCVHLGDTCGRLS